MAKFLAHENVPGDAVEAARRAGMDIIWVRDISPGISDDTVLTLSQVEGRVLLTFDKDFGELAFEQRKTATAGVILLRPRLRSPDYVAQFTVALLTQPIDWEGNFSVAQEGRLRVVPCLISWTDQQSTIAARPFADRMAPCALSHEDSIMHHATIALLLTMFVSLSVHGEDKPPLKAGIIGLDTSHVVAFTQTLNNPKAEGVLSRVRVVAAYPGGSSDIPSSRDRVEGYTKTLRDKFGVEIVDSIDALLKKVDVVLLESVDGRPHLEQVKPVFRAKKPVFIDKPVAGSLADAVEIYRLAKESATPCFSSSSLRFSPGIRGVRTDPKFGSVLGCDSYGPCELEPHHPDLFWYGIHGVETLFTIMGPGCESVTRTKADNAEFVTGKWKDGRVGTFRGMHKGKYDYGAMVFGTKMNGPSGRYDGYEPLVIEICKFFESGKPPVTAEETLEIYAFMEAADESKRQGGKPVTLASVLDRAGAKGK